MKLVRFEQAEQYEPEEGWKRVSLAGNEHFSFEWFQKPPGHASPRHDHDNDQVCIVFEGKLTVYTENDEVTLGEYDSVLLEGGESHTVENTGEAVATGLDVFAPGRSFDFWLQRDDG